MPVLHFRISSAQENIKLSRSLHAQNFTLRRAVVVKDASIPNPTDIPYDGGCCVEVSFFTGFEVLSNMNSNDILIPFDSTKEMNDPRFTLNFSSEEIRPSFSVSVFTYTKEHKCPFGAGPGEIKFIDLFFEFSELFDYNTY
jgi:hypothetical protein